MKSSFFLRWKCISLDVTADIWFLSVPPDYVYYKLLMFVLYYLFCFERIQLDLNYSNKNQLLIYDISSFRPNLAPSYTWFSYLHFNFYIYFPITFNSVTLIQLIIFLCVISSFTHTSLSFKKFFFSPSLSFYISAIYMSHFRLRYLAGSFFPLLFCSYLSPSQSPVLSLILQRSIYSSLPHSCLIF